MRKTTLLLSLSISLGVAHAQDQLGQYRINPLTPAATAIQIKVASGVPLMRLNHAGQTSMKGALELQDDGVMKVQFGVDYAAAGTARAYIYGGTTPYVSIWPAVAGTVVGHSLCWGTSGDLTWCAAANVSGFTDDGTVVRLTTSTDQVGVGTASPASGAKLHLYVSGDHTRLRMQADSGKAALIDFHSGATALWSIGRDNTQTYFKLENRTTSNDGMRLYDSEVVSLVPSAGSVGIGTAAPGTNAKLAVVGAITIGGPFTADAALHVSGNYGGLDRVAQFDAVGVSKPGLILVASTDGASARQGWVAGVDPDASWKINSGDTFSATPDLKILSGNVSLGVAGSFLDLLGNCTPAAGAAASARLCVDAGGGGGKHRLLVQFGSGAAQVLATEP